MFFVNVGTYIYMYTITWILWVSSNLFCRWVFVKLEGSKCKNWFIRMGVDMGTTLEIFVCWSICLVYLFCFCFDLVCLFCFCFCYVGFVSANGCVRVSLFLCFVGLFVFLVCLSWLIVCFFVSYFLPYLCSFCFHCCFTWFSFKVPPEIIRKFSGCSS